LGERGLQILGDQSRFIRLRIRECCSSWSREALAHKNQCGIVYILRSMSPVPSFRLRRTVPVPHQAPIGCCSNFGQSKSMTVEHESLPRSIGSFAIMLDIGLEREPSITFGHGQTKSSCHIGTVPVRKTILILPCALSNSTIGFRRKSSSKPATTLIYPKSCRLFVHLLSKRAVDASTTPTPRSRIRCPSFTSTRQFQQMTGGIVDHPQSECMPRCL